MSLFTWLGFRSATLHRAAVQRRQPPRRTTYRPHLELLEDRCLLASGLSASLVADINPGEYPSNPQHLTNVNGTLYFGISANGGPLYGTSSSSSLWKSDGTAAGTVLVKDVFPQSFTSIGGSVFFTSGGHLWKTDGTTAGTVVLFGGGAEEPTAFNDKVVFAGEEEL